MTNFDIHVGVCEAHKNLFHLSFAKALMFTMPKHWRGLSMCSKTNCHRDATFWMVIDLRLFEGFDAEGFKIARQEILAA